MALQGSEETGLGSIPTAAGSDSPGVEPATVTQIIPGAGIDVAPPGGTGAVTVSNAGVRSLIPGTGIGLSAATGDITVTNTDPASAVQAEWALATTRYFAVDVANGNDANAGFSDVSNAAAGLVAKKTLAGLAAIFPRIMAGRKFVVSIAAGSYTGQGGLEQIFGGATGWANGSCILATGTNSTAGAVAFSGSAADRTFLGMTTATGMNAAGYTPTGAATTTSVPCTKVGGAAPGFGAEPAIPLGMRMRFDVNTATVALRNICRMVYQVPATDTLVPQVAWPAAPAATDTFYIEQPAVVVDGTTISMAGLTGLTIPICGFAFASLNQLTPITGMNFAGCTVTGNFNVRAGNVAPQNNYLDENLTTRTQGMGLRCASNLVMTFTSTLNSSSASLALMTVGVTTINGDSSHPFWTNGAQTWGGLLIQAIQGSASGNSEQPPGTIGGRSHTSEPTNRVRGSVAISGTKNAGMHIMGSSLTLDELLIEQMGANPAIVVDGKCTVSMSSFQAGTTGNNDVGVDLTAARDATIILYGTPTLTGALGDVRLADNTIISWATAMAGVIDSSGNRLFAAGNAPGHYTAVTAGAVTVAITNAPAGSAAAPVRYVKVPDGAGGFYTFASLT